MSGEISKPVDSENSPPDEPEQSLILDAVREEVRQQLPKDMHSVSMQVAMQSGQQAFIEKLTPSHVDKVLDYTQKDKTQGHHRFLTVFIGSLLVFLVLSALFLYFDKDSLLEQIVAAIVGFLGGYGFGKSSG